MGYRTIAVIRHDHIDKALQNPAQLLRALELSTNSGRPMEFGSGAGGTVLCYDDRDPQLVLFSVDQVRVVGTLEGKAFNADDDEAVDEALPEMLRQKGFKIQHLSKRQ